MPSFTSDNDNKLVNKGPSKAGMPTNIGKPAAAAAKPAAPAKKAVDVIVEEVIKGDWGNGEERKTKLTEAGYDYDMVQRAVNRKLGAEAPAKSIEDLAKEVIRGDWGNGADRKAKLEAAGFDYNAVQAKVNELLK
ncbi:MAG: hypothetical protein IJ225_00285 [Solobacterium sp.]|nr:hypothetical protein [Solobacterium sp.]